MRPRRATPTAAVAKPSREERQDGAVLAGFKLEDAMALVETLRIELQDLTAGRIEDVALFADAVRLLRLTEMAERKLRGALRTILQERA